MGTPDFAVPTLERLADSRHTVLAAVTNPDRPKGRGRKLASSPVKERAQALKLPVIQPESVNDARLQTELTALAPDLFIVVAFSVLPKALLAVPRIGSVNLHPSLLPAYRGAAPIVWAVANGEQETGISTFLLNPRVDAGDILMQRRIAIAPDETAGQLEARLCLLGADMVLETVDSLENGSLTPLPQNCCGVTRAPKLSKEDGRIDWSQSAVLINNRIRGFNPFPGAFTTLAGQPLKVHRAQPTEGTGTPGQVIQADARNGLLVACGQGALNLKSVQLPGKAPMETSAFLLGNPIAAGACLGD